MAPKVPNKIYNAAAVTDEPVMTFVAFTDGSEGYINSVVLVALHHFNFVFVRGAEMVVVEIIQVLTFLIKPSRYRYN